MRGLLILLCLAASTQFVVAQETEAPLGFPVTLTDIYIPGSEVQPIPRKDRTGSLVIRILDVKPAADGFRYDMEVYGLDPGIHHLGEYLQRENDGTTLDAWENTIHITTTQPLDTLPKPTDLTPVPPSKVGGYRLLTIILGVIWFGVLLFILFYRKKQPAAAVPPPPPPTLHQKLHGLVSQAAEGRLSENEQAQLERLIVGHWKQELPDLETLSPSEAIRHLRTHPEASPLILKLEEWLHAPNSSTTQDDINHLLAPFR